MITTGVIPHFSDIPKDYVLSVAYSQDDFTWCIQNSGKFPIWLNYFYMATPVVWILIVIFGLYVPGTLIYFRMDIDQGWNNRKNRDWHYYIILVVGATFLGMPPFFKPTRSFSRIFLVIQMILPLPIHIYIGNFIYHYMKYEFHRYQISTVQEIITKKSFHFYGSEDVLNAIKSNELVCNMHCIRC